MHELPILTETVSSDMFFFFCFGRTTQRSVETAS